MGGARAEHQAAINSMMMERMSTDIYALKKQYARIKRRQQQQAMQLYIRTGGRERRVCVLSQGCVSCIVTWRWCRGGERRCSGLACRMRDV